MENAFESAGKQMPRYQQLPYMTKGVHCGFDIKCFGNFPLRPE